MGKRSKRGKDRKPPRFAIDHNILVAPLWIVNRDGDPVMAVFGDGVTELFDPKTSQPRLRLGPMELVNDLTSDNPPQIIRERGWGVEVLDPNQATQAALFHGSDAESGWGGRVLLYGNGPSPALEATACKEGDAGIFLYSSNPDAKGCPAVEIHSRETGGRARFNSFSKERGRTLDSSFVIHGGGVSSDDD